MEHIGQVASMMLVCLILAFLIGIFFGWLLHQILGAKSSGTAVHDDSADRKRISELELALSAAQGRNKEFDLKTSDCEKNLAAAKNLASDTDVKLKAAQSKLSDYELRLAEAETRVKEVEVLLAASSPIAATAAVATGAVVAATLPPSTPTPLTTDLLLLVGLEHEDARRLIDAGVPNQAELLKQGASPTGRRELAVKANIESSRLLTWLNHVDLNRIHGVNEVMAELFEKAGVDTVNELSHRNVENLHKRIAEVNAEFKRLPISPTLEQVAGWIDEAKTLPRSLTY